MFEKITIICKNDNFSYSIALILSNILNGSIFLLILKTYNTRPFLYQKDFPVYT